MEFLRTQEAVQRMLDKKFEESESQDYEDGRGKLVWQLGYLCLRHADLMNEVEACQSQE